MRPFSSPRPQLDDPLPVGRSAPIVSRADRRGGQSAVRAAGRRSRPGPLRLLGRRTTRQHALQEQPGRITGAARTSTVTRVSPRTTTPSTVATTRSVSIRSWSPWSQVPHPAGRQHVGQAHGGDTEVQGHRHPRGSRATPWAGWRAAAAERSAQDEAADRHLERPDAPIELDPRGDVVPGCTAQRPGERESGGAAPAALSQAGCREKAQADEAHQRGDAASHASTVPQDRPADEAREQRRAAHCDSVPAPLRPG